jgi:hypothetical protein
LATSNAGKSGNVRPAGKSYSGTNSSGKAPAAGGQEAEGVAEGRALLQAAGLQQLTDSLAILYNMQVSDAWLDLDMVTAVTRIVLLLRKVCSFASATHDGGMSGLCSADIHFN